MNELAFDLCAHKGPRGGKCEAPIARGLLTGAWFHRGAVAWTFPPKAWDHVATPSDHPQLLVTRDGR